MSRRFAAVCLLLFAACRTTRPPNAEPLQPLTSTTPAEAARQLEERRANFRGERSLVRVKLGTISARAQLQVDAAGRVLMTIYSPIGTTVARLYSENDEVLFINDLERTVSSGKASDFGAFGGPTPFLLIGLPPPGLSGINYGPAGIESVQVPDTTIRFDPPVYPPKRVIVDHGAHHIEIEHLDSFIDPTPVTKPDIPASYTCCVAPPL